MIMVIIVIIIIIIDNEHRYIWLYLNESFLKLHAETGSLLDCSNTLPGDKSHNKKKKKKIVKQVKTSLQRCPLTSFDSKYWLNSWVIFHSFTYLFIYVQWGFYETKVYVTNQCVRIQQAPPTHRILTSGRQCATGCWFPGVWKVPAFLLSRSAAATPLSSSYTNCSPTRTLSAASIVPCFFFFSAFPFFVKVLL